MTKTTTTTTLTQPKATPIASGRALVLAFAQSRRVSPSFGGAGRAARQAYAPVTPLADHGPRRPLGCRNRAFGLLLPLDHSSSLRTAATSDQRCPHERLDCYQLLDEAVAFVTAQRHRGRPGEAGPQLERAAVRALLNVAEAAGRQGPRDRARAFAIARGETCEAAAALRVAALYGALTSGEAAWARARLIRVGQMLSRLARAQ